MSSTRREWGQAARQEMACPGQKNGQMVEDKSLVSCCLHPGGSQGVAPAPVGSASTENVLEMQILRFYLQLCGTETLGVGSSSRCWNKPFKQFHMLRFESHLTLSSLWTFGQDSPCSAKCLSYVLGEQTASSVELGDDPRQENLSGGS